MNSVTNPKYITNATRESADINLFDTIGDGHISGQEVADEIQMLNDFGVKTINIHINSPGGSILDGLSIFTAIKNSKATVNTHIVVAASIAGIIALAGKKVFMADFGKLMIHNPSINGDESPEDKKQATALQSLRDSLITILKGRSSGITKEEISELMDNETWLTAQEALTKGFIDEIVKVSASNKAPLLLEQITNVYNSDNPKPSKMKNVTTYLQLSEDATEESILNAIKEIATARDTATTDLEARDVELKTATDLVDKQKLTITSFEENATEINKKIVEDAVEAAITAGKLDKEKKDEIIEKFENNVPALELMIGSLKTGAVTITNSISNSESSANTGIPADRKDWSFRKWDKEDNAGLMEIKANNLDLFKSMYKEQYKADFAG